MGIALKVVRSFQQRSMLQTLPFRWLFNDDIPHHKHSKGVLMGIALKVVGSFQQRSMLQTLPFRWLFHDDTPHHKHSHIQSSANPLIS